MKLDHTHLAAALIALALVPAYAAAEILAMVNYESKSPDSLKVLKNPVATGPRKEGIAVIDVDPTSKAFGQTIQDMPLPSDHVAHHIFYNKDSTKAYVTSLGKSELRVIDMTRRPFEMKKVDVPGCTVGEDVVFSGDNKSWFLTCMGSQAMIMGDARTDQPVKTVKLTKPYPHGIAIHDGIDRVLLTSTVRASDLGDAGETITVAKASTGEVLGSHKVSTKASPAGEAPVEVLFVPGANPPVAYVTNMYGGTLWAATWNPAKQDFDVAQFYDFATVKAGVPLEMYFNSKGDRFYVTTAKPGQMHIFEVGKDGRNPAAQIQPRRGRSASRRVHQGRPLRIRAKRPAESSGDERRLDHRHRYAEGSGGRECRHAQEPGIQPEQHRASAPVERPRGALGR